MPEKFCNATMYFLANLSCLELGVRESKLISLTVGFIFILYIIEIGLNGKVLERIEHFKKDR